MGEETATHAILLSYIIYEGHVHTIESYLP